jgi:hypothetical protein
MNLFRAWTRAGWVGESSSPMVTEGVVQLFAKRF